MKTKNLFLATILVAVGAINGSVGQTTFYGTGNMAFGSAGISTTNGTYNIFMGEQSGVNNTDGGHNIFLGLLSGRNNIRGNQNIFMGTQAGNSNLSGNRNIFLGHQSGISNTTGTENIFLGYGAGTGNISGINNTAIGTTSGASLIGGQFNSFLGYQSGVHVTSGIKNSCVGFKSGEGLTVGNANSFLGYVSTLTNVSNTIILADGDSNQRVYIHSNGYAGIGLGNNNIPNNRLEITAGFTPSGLRMRNLPNIATTLTSPNPSNRVLSVDVNGDVILVDDKLGDVLPDNFVTNSCAVGDFVPKVDTSNTDNLVCSQIYDNGTSVGIGTTGGFTYDFATGIPPFTGGALPMSGTVKLNVNGIIKTTGIFATSDQKFKRDIKSIDSALKTVEALEGKTYFWDKKANGNLDFDNAPHSGFLAQDIEKVLPHLVITDEKGLKAVNYLEIIPYLVESIKEQQTQINELKYLVEKLVEKETTINTSDVKLSNTKIINVTPNPSKGDVVVTLFVEKEVSNAQLVIFDLTGKKRGSFEINDFDTNSNIKLSKENYGEGTFILSLFANNKMIDSKKVIFN